MASRSASGPAAKAGPSFAEARPRLEQAAPLGAPTVHALALAELLAQVLERRRGD